MLKNKVVVITGGAGLLGQEFVKAVIEQDGISIIADIDEKRSKQLKSEIQQKYNKSEQVYHVKIDINNKDTVIKAIDEIIKKFGKIDAWVNNAYPRNKNYGKSFFDVRYEDFCENINLNLGGYFLCSQLISKYFLETGKGNIINISSIYGVIPPKFEIYDGTKMTMPVEYAVIKSGLIHFTKYMAKYFKGKNIRVNTISPGGIFDSQPASFIEKYNKQALSKGMLRNYDLKGTLLYLLSDLSEFVNGQNIIVDDGFTL